MQQNKHFKYGLNLPTKKSSQQSEKTLRRSIFTEDDDGTPTRNVNKTLVNKDSSLSKLVQEQYKAALEEDPTVFSYDEVYDDMKNAERKTLQEFKGI
jgi:coiled-coil domain-containing protein 55